MSPYAEAQLPRSFTYFQEASPNNAQYGSFWVMSDGTVHVYTPLGWILLGGGGGGGPVILTDPNGGLWLLGVDENGAVTTTKQ